MCVLCVAVVAAAVVVVCVVTWLLRHFISLWNNHYNSIHGLTTVHTMGSLNVASFRCSVQSRLIYSFFISFFFSPYHCYCYYCRWCYFFPFAIALLFHTSFPSVPNTKISECLFHFVSLVIRNSNSFLVFCFFFSIVGASTNSSAAKLALELLNEWRVDLKTSFIMFAMRNFLCIIYDISADIRLSFDLPLFLSFKFSKYIYTMCVCVRFILFRVNATIIAVCDASDCCAKCQNTNHTKWSLSDS